MASFSMEPIGWQAWLILRLKRSAKQRGFSLIVAVVVIAVLTMTGAMIIEGAIADVTLAGGQRAAEDALYMAEAGSAWAAEELTNVLYPTGYQSGVAPQLSALVSKPALTVGHTLCRGLTDAACIEGRWLTVSAGQTYGNGGYQVAVFCTPLPRCQDNVPAPVAYNLRIAGYGRGQVQRLLEVTMGIR